MHKFSFINTADVMKNSSHGTHAKDLAVLHETVSPDVVGISDITGVESYLARIGYGIHGMTDLEGHMAWALGMGEAIFYHAGGVNERAIGIEQVSDIPADLASKKITIAQARVEWLKRDTQLRATAQLLAAWHTVSPKTHLLVASNGMSPGVCAHWNVSQHFSDSEGHTDCWPVNDGGYYPLSLVITYAKEYAAEGYRF